MSFIKIIQKNKDLIIQLTKREILGRYKGSKMGILWSLLNPLIMLVIYTFIFTVVFKARWNTNELVESKGQFSLLIFVGMIIQNLFAEIINRAPNTIVANVNYVKKVVFPLETLSLINSLAALFHLFISFLVLILGFLAINHYINWTIIFFPLVLLPLLVFILGISWILNSIGVFIKDTGQVMVLVTTILMFLSPIFYPVEALPLRFQSWILLNPLTFIIEQSREVIIWGHLPNFKGLAIYCAPAFLVAFIGYAFFKKSKRAFADVL